VEDEATRLMRTVAEAAEAWLTDPRDTQTYQRLVAATLARRVHLGRAGAAPVGTSSGDRPLGATPDSAAPDDAAPDDAEPPDGAGPPERQPQRLDSVLGGFADQLRARTALSGAAGAGTDAAADDGRAETGGPLPAQSPPGASAER